jgi:hypothetical protein
MTLSSGESAHINSLKRLRRFVGLYLEKKYLFDRKMCPLYSSKYLL